MKNGANRRSIWRHHPAPASGQPLRTDPHDTQVSVLRTHHQMPNNFIFEVLRTGVDSMCNQETACTPHPHTRMSLSRIFSRTEQQREKSTYHPDSLPSDSSRAPSVSRPRAPSSAAHAPPSRPLCRARAHLYCSQARRTANSQGCAVTATIATYIPRPRFRRPAWLAGRDVTTSPRRCCCCGSAAETGAGRSARRRVP